MHKAWAYATATLVASGMYGCSSAPAAYENAAESTGTTEEAFNETSCLTATPDDTFTGSIARYISPISGGITGYNSRLTYSNPKCYKSAA